MLLPLSILQQTLLFNKCFYKSLEQYRSKLSFPFLAVSDRNISQPGDTLCILSNFLGIFQNLVVRLGKN